jgi:AraC-like DNA-binding protein/diphthamide synthase (EF-2-diphthine--ammonia ligase)
LAWAGDKESAWSLHALRQDPSCRVAGLIATVDRAAGRLAYDRASRRFAFLGVRRSLLEEQAEGVGLPLCVVELSSPCSHEEHRAAVLAGFGEAELRGVLCMAFGDLFREDAREYHRRLLASSLLEALFPIWGHDTRVLARTMIDAGVKAWITGVETSDLPARTAGRPWDGELLTTLPEGVDPCGGNGEFRTFVESAPGWQQAVPVRPGEIVQRDGFAFVDLLPKCKRSGIEGDPEATGAFDYFERLGRVEAYVDDHIGEDFRMPVVAAEAAMSTAGFSRFFHERVGLCFTEWLTVRRIARAQALFREHNYTVARVASQVGFGSERSFRRAFRRFVGCSPSEFKRDVCEGLRGGG